ncbi:uncharacterized protein LOC131890202 [Tigriopus californicus]|uniref:uncharacterized protein LOC131890202 n=1 Tax=Tigriopus californicus TaxID=6832 RepID=UPI0027DA69E6|nr:uncharacterized protein LOC131890202 [Tigriopus californicus]
MASKDKVRVIALLAIMFCQIAISQPFQWPKDRVTINRSSEQDQSKKADLKVDLKTESSQQPREIKVIQSDEAQERIAAGRRRPPVIRLAPPRLRRKLPPPQAEEKLFFNGARGRRRPKRPVHGGYGPPRPQYGPPKHRPRPTFKKTRPKFRGRPQPHGHPKPRYPVISYRPRPQYSVPTLPVGYDGPSSYPSPAPIQSDNHDTYGSPPSTTGNNVYPSTVDEDEYGSPKGQPQNDEYGSPLADAQDGYGSPQAPKQEAGTFSGYGGEFNPPSFSISGGNSLEDYGSPSGPTKTINNGAQSQLYQGYESPQTPTQSGYSSPSTDQEDSYGLPQASPAKDLDGFPVPDFNEYAPSGDPVFDFSNDDSDDVENYSSQPRPSSIDDEEDGDISFGFPEFPTPNFLNFPSEYTPDFHFDLKKVNEPDENENEDESTSPSPLTGQYQPPSSFQPSYEIESQEENFDTYESPNPSGATGPNQYNGPPSPNSFPYGASAQENEVEDTYDNGFEPDFQPSGDGEGEGGTPAYYPPTTPQVPEPSFAYEKPSVKPDSSSYYKPPVTSSPDKNQPSSYQSPPSEEIYSPPMYSSRQPSIIQEEERQVDFQSYDAPPSKDFPSEEFPSEESGEFYTPDSNEEKEPTVTYTKPFSGAQHTQYSPPKATSSSSKPSQPFPTSYVNVEDVNSSPYQPHASQGPPQNGQYTPYEEEDEEEEYPNQPSGGDSVYYKPSSSPQTSLYEQSNQNAPKPSPTPSEVYYKPIEGTENEEPSNSNNFYDNGGDDVDEEVSFNQYQRPSSPTKSPTRESLFGGGFFDFKFPSYDKEINDVSFSYEDREQVESSSTENPRYKFAPIPTEDEEDQSSDDFEFYSSGNARPSNPSEGPAKDFGKYKKIPSFAPPNDKFLYKTPKRPQSSQPSYSEPFSGQPSTGSPPSPSGNFDAYGSPRAPQRYPQAEDDQDEPEIYTQSFNEEENEAPSQHNSYGSPKAPSVEPNDHNNFKQFSPPSNGGGREKYVRQFNSFPTEAPPTKDRNQFFKSRQPSKPSQLDSYGGPEGPVSEEVDVPFTPSQYPAPSSPSFPTSAIEQEDSYDSPRAPPTYPKFQESTNSDIPNQEVVFKYQPEGPEVPPLYSPEEISEDQFDQQFNPEDLKNFEPYSEQSNEFGENEFSESDFGEDEFNQYSPPRENNDEEPSGAFPPGPSGAIKVIEYDPYSEPDDFPSRFENTERPPKQSSRNRQRYQTSDISSSQGPLRTTKARQRTKLIKDASPTPVYKSRQVSNYRSRQKNPTQSSDTFEIHEARPSPTPNRPLSTRPTYNQQTQSNVNFEPSGSSNDDETLPEQPFQPELDGNTYYKDIPTSAPPSRNPVYQSKYQTLPVDDQSGTRGERIRPEYSDQNQAWPSSLNSENEYFETEDSEFDFPTGPNDEETLYKESKSEPEEIKPSRTPYRPSPETPKSTGASQDVSYPRGRTTQAPDLPSYPAVPDQYSTFNPSPSPETPKSTGASQDVSYPRGRTTQAPDLPSYPAVPDQYSTFNPSPTDENQSNPKEEEPTRTYKQANPRVGENFSDDDFMPSEIRATPSRRPRRPLRPSRRSDTPKEEDEKESDREDMESDGEDAKELKSIGFGPSTFHFGMETPDIWEMFNSEWGQKVKSDN